MKVDQFADFSRDLSWFPTDKLLIC